MKYGISQADSSLVQQKVSIRAEFFFANGIIRHRQVLTAGVCRPSRSSKEGRAGQDIGLSIVQVQTILS